MFGSTWNFLTIPIYMLTKDFKILKKFGGTPHLAPQKLSPQNHPPMTTYNPYFLLQIPFLLSNKDVYKKKQYL